MVIGGSARDQGNTRETASGQQRPKDPSEGEDARGRGRQEVVAGGQLVASVPALERALEAKEEAVEVTFA